MARNNSPSFAIGGISDRELAYYGDVLAKNGIIVNWGEISIKWPQIDASKASAQPEK